MKGNTHRYLDLISLHLYEQHAAILVGSGFSRNADKVSSDVPDIPLWGDLTKAFKEKLDPTHKSTHELDATDPLTLAEHIEIAYGRSELDRLLLCSICDSDYQPSQLHRKLLQLPWTDVFTTNYDTLLERASEDITEQSISCILSQNDLLGSSGKTRIIKLHGSFPSQRPFIITSEDYRTYPQKFAPFVNTVQQALLENTFCMIGFSGDDPNFNNWIGWIRDNLGAQNSPYMYLLLHSPPSDTRREWLRRRNIIPVDLSEIFPGESASTTYEKALDYLWDKYCKFNETQQKWIPKAPVASSPHPLPIKSALPILRQNRDNFPKTLTLSGERLAHLRSTVISPASQILSAHCTQEMPDTDNELEYLYEYDWLRGKALLPLFSSDLKCYQEILDRHVDDHSTHIFSIRLSILRTLREYSDWSEWEEYHQQLLSDISHFTQDQLHQLRWEECLCFLSRYEFQQLKQHLESWNVSADMTLWALRKAGIWAEYGECENAHILLQQAIINLRRRLSHQMKPDLFLLSLESAMMNLQSFISQARQSSTITDEGKDGKQKENEFIDGQHRARHNQYHVSWEERNSYFVPRLEATWEPFLHHKTEPTFDFGRTISKTRYQEDKDRILAFSFLRFREETGMPFRIRNIYSDKKAACGAAERVALFMPQLAILTLVRADEPKEVENTITRGVLSSWTQEETDQRCQFYLDAVLRTEDELTTADWFFRNSFARLAADVLPEVLSELCSKCSIVMLNKLLELLQHLYTSPKRLCYQQTVSLTKRLIPSFPVSARKELLLRLARFPLNNQDEDHSSRYFPEPLQFLPFPSDGCKQVSPSPIPEIQSILTSPLSDNNRNKVLDHLLYCFYHGLLSVQQKTLLGELLWNDGKLLIPNNWCRTVCLELPVPQNIDVRKYLSERITENIKGYSDGGIRANNDEIILYELANFALTNASDFSLEQMSSILSAFSRRVASLSRNLARSEDFFGINRISASQLYGICRSLWILTSCKENWTPTTENRQAMSEILDVCEQVSINHHGLRSIWNNLLDRSFSAESELTRCLRSTDDLCSYYSYDVLATAIHNSELPLLHITELREGVAIMAQQIAWCIPKQLAAALRTAATAAQYQPELLCDSSLELMLAGLSELIEQTVITSDDNVESASKKGSIRKEAAFLAQKLHQSGLKGKHPEVLSKWLDVTQCKDEFSEIRCVQ